MARARRGAADGAVVRAAAGGVRLRPVDGAGLGGRHRSGRPGTSGLHAPGLRIGVGYAGPALRYIGGDYAGTGPASGPPGFWGGGAAFGHLGPYTGPALAFCGGVPGAVSALRGGLCGGAAVRMGNRLPGKPLFRRGRAGLGAGSGPGGPVSGAAGASRALFRRVGVAVQGYGGGAVSEEENIRLVREIGEVKAELSGLKAEVAGTNQRLDDIVITQLKDHGKRLAALDVRIAALEAAENKRAGGLSVLAGVAAAAGSLGALIMKFFTL